MKIICYHTRVQIRQLHLQTCTLPNIVTLLYTQEFSAIAVQCCPAFIDEEKRLMGNERDSERKTGGMRSENIATACFLHDTVVTIKSLTNSEERKFNSIQIFSFY